MHSSRLDLKAAEQLGVKFLKEWLNCDTLDEARKLDAKYIEERFLESGLAMGSVIDGVYLTDDPSEILKQGKMSQVPIMTGNTSNEFMTGPSSEDEATITQWVNQNFGPHADEYMEICRRIVEREGVSLREAVTVGSLNLESSLHSSTSRIRTVLSITTFLVPLFPAMMQAPSILRIYGSPLKP